MFFKRREKRCHPWLTLTLCGMSAVGALVAVSKCRCFLSEKLGSLSKMMKKGCDGRDD